MQWKHRTKLSWLQERQKHLTASDIYSLIPYTKTGRPKKITEDDYLKVWAKKQVKLTEDDCLSFGAAARGHLLEPYAVDSFNAGLGWASSRLKHIDDELYCSTTANTLYSLAWSPDAINDSKTMMGEIKSYSAEKHIATIVADKMQCEERWQIATAMTVTRSIDTGFLILFNPDLWECQVSWKRYTPDELVNEIATIQKIEKEFNDWARIFESELPKCSSSTWSSKAIKNAILEKQELNPI